MGKIEIVSPSELYNCVEIPDKVIRKVEKLLRDGRCKNPLDAIPINISSLEHIILEHEADFDPDYTVQDVLTSLLLLFSEKWSIEYKNAILYFKPFIRDDGVHRFRVIAQFSRHVAERPTIGTAQPSKN